MFLTNQLKFASTKPKTKKPFHLDIHFRRFVVAYKKNFVLLSHAITFQRKFAQVFVFILYTQTISTFCEFVVFFPSFCKLDHEMAYLCS